MDKNTELEDKLRALLALSRECISLKEETEVLNNMLYDDFWNSLEEVESTLTYLKGACLI